ncbi:hypothetical protein DIPPA_15602 [Diplonema papillatum]|nr:hypothetical protein DIPPA_15602 [Diplonema papillatum]
MSYQQPAGERSWKGDKGWWGGTPQTDWGGTGYEQPHQAHTLPLQPHAQQLLQQQHQYPHYLQQQQQQQQPHPQLHHHLHQQLHHMPAQLHHQQQHQQQPPQPQQPQQPYLGEAAFRKEWQGDRDARASPPPQLAAPPPPPSSAPSAHPPLWVPTEEYMHKGRKGGPASDSPKSAAASSWGKNVLLEPAGDASSDVPSKSEHGKGWKAAAGKGGKDWYGAGKPPLVKKGAGRAAFWDVGPKGANVFAGKFGGKIGKKAGKGAKPGKPTQGPWAWRRRPRGEPRNKTLRHFKNIKMKVRPRRIPDKLLKFQLTSFRGNVYSVEVVNMRQGIVDAAHHLLGCEEVCVDIRPYRSTHDSDFVCFVQFSIPAERKVYVIDTLSEGTMEFWYWIEWDWTMWPWAAGPLSLVWKLLCDGKIRKFSMDSVPVNEYFAAFGCGETQSMIDVQLMASSFTESRDMVQIIKDVAGVTVEKPEVSPAWYERDVTLHRLMNAAFDVVNMMDLRDLLVEKMKPWPIWRVPYAGEYFDVTEDIYKERGKARNKATVEVAETCLRPFLDWLGRFANARRLFTKKMVMFFVKVGHGRAGWRGAIFRSYLRASSGGAALRKHLASHIAAHANIRVRDLQVPPLDVLLDGYAKGLDDAPQFRSLLIPWMNNIKPEVDAREAALRAQRAAAAEAGHTVEAEEEDEEDEEEEETPEEED